MKLKFILGVAFSSCILLGLMLIILFFSNTFNYRGVIEPVYINSADLVRISTADRKLNSLQETLIQKLHKDKLILTPQEYTNNVVGYYNILVVVMASLMVVFSIISLFHFRNSIKEQVSEKIDDVVSNQVIQGEIVNKLKEKTSDWTGDILEEAKEEITNQIAFITSVVKSSREEQDQYIESLENQVNSLRAEVEYLKTFLIDDNKPLNLEEENGS
jgi:amino acid transporter